MLRIYEEWGYWRDHGGGGADMWVHRRIRWTAAAGLAAAGLAVAAPGQAYGWPGAGAPRGESYHKSHESSLVVRTDKGLLRGSRAHGVDSFLGIRYAKAPARDRRWRPPQPPERWSGVRPALAYGNRCPQLASTNGPQSLTEDCLFLNVWRPSAVSGHGRLPVLVFIHGGGLLNGSSNQHDGTAIVRREGIIVVSLNYRLGVFGFLADPALSAAQGESGNYGFDDQQAALRWVQRNIAAFGGNPGRVTIDGESAGGWSVCGHMTSPRSRGLFSAAIIQSGSCASVPEAQAEQTGTSIAAAAGCANPATAVRCLRRTDVLSLLKATPGPLLFASGTTTFPVAPAAAVKAGDFTRVPVINGSNRDEGRTFALGDIGWTQSQYVDWVKATFPSDYQQVLARYPWPSNATRFTSAYLAGAIITDSGLLTGIGGCGALSLTQELAHYTRTWQYEFDHRDGPGLVPIPGYHWGAGHAAELAYLWPSFDNGIPIAPTFNAAERQLARDMKDYWGAMVVKHRPDVRRLAFWPMFNRSTRILSLRADGKTTAITEAAYSTEHRCGFWISLNNAHG